MVTTQDCITSFSDARADNSFVPPSSCLPDGPTTLITLLTLLKSGVKKHFMLSKPLTVSPTVGSYDVSEAFRKRKRPGPVVVVISSPLLSLGLGKSKRIITTTKAIGTVISANTLLWPVTCPQWRPDDDHRKGMSARKEQVAA
jgi:hypothetical protein